MVTTAQKVAALRREIALRRNVFPGRVRLGKMTQAEAYREIAVMEAILADYLQPTAELAVA
jgi:hypothetical protein